MLHDLQRVLNASRHAAINEGVIAQLASEVDDLGRATVQVGCPKLFARSYDRAECLQPGASRPTQTRVKQPHQGLLGTKTSHLKQCTDGEGYMQDVDWCSPGCCCIVSICRVLKRAALSMLLTLPDTLDSRGLSL